VDVLKLLSDLVSIRSVNNPERGEKPSREIVDYVARILGDEDFEVEVVDNCGYYSVVGVKGFGEPRLLFLSHLDVVPWEGQPWSYPPGELTVVGDRAYGRGVLDDKGNAAAILSAVEGFKPSKGTLIVAFTTDEEVGGRCGARFLGEQLVGKGLRPDYVINADGNGMVVTIRRRAVYRAVVCVRRDEVVVRGRSEYVEYNFSGVNRHSAYFVPGADVHPLVSLSAYVRSKGLLVSSMGGTFIKANVVPEKVFATVVERGPGGEVVADRSLSKLISSVIPLTRITFDVDYSDFGISSLPNFYELTDDEHRITLDIRAMTLKRDAVRQAIERALRENGVDGTVEVTGGDGYLNTDREARVVKAAVQALAEVGVEPKVGELPGASDSRHFFDRITREVIDFGPIGGNIHGPDEYVELSSLNTVSRFYRRVAELLLG